jgi:heptosyltransferase-2
MGAVFPTRLVVDLPNWVGDQVMTVPAVHRLVVANAGGETTLHLRPPVERLFRLLFPGARVAASRPKEFPFAVAHRLCRHGGRFEIGVTLRHAYRAKIMLRVAARRTLGSGGSGARMLLSERFAVDRSRHQIFDADPLLELLELEGVDPAWIPSLPEALSEEGGRELERLGLPVDRAIGLAPAAAWGDSKRWPADRFGELSRRLSDRGLRPVVVIGPGEEEVAEAACSALARELPVLGAELDVAGLAGVLSRLALLVCNDSGPMHVAAMVGTPAVALFGPTDPMRTRPLGERHVVVSRQLDCAPCGERVCPLGHTACLSDLGIEVVERSVLEILEDTSGSSR